jgi:NADH-quinone oxidoreductase subunit G
VEGVSDIARHSVISLNKYKILTMPKETVEEVMNGSKPRLLMDIHSVSEVNNPSVHLSEIDRPATSNDFK